MDVNKYIIQIQSGVSVPFTGTIEELEVTVEGIRIAAPKAKIKVLSRDGVITYSTWEEQMLHSPKENVHTVAGHLEALKACNQYIKDHGKAAFKGLLTGDQAN